MKYIIPAFLLLLLAASVSAEIQLVEPKAGETVGPTSRFTFFVESGETIGACHLLVDAQIAKSATYNSVLRGRTLSFSMVGDEGDHTWTVQCETPSGNVTAPAESFSLSIPQTTVSVKPSGTVRGSMVRSFTMQNNAQQQPVVVPSIATGDYLGVSLKIPPSTLTKEFYVRQRTVTDGKPRLWLTFKQENYYLTQGENTTLNLTNSARVLATIQGIENNRAVVVFYPAVSGSVQPTEELPEEPAQPEEPVTNTTNATAPTEPTQEPEPADAPRQGIFKRFLGWLAGIFGA